MRKEILDYLSCADELRELDELYAKKKQDTDEAIKQRRKDCWNLVEEESAPRHRIFELELQEAQEILKRLCALKRTRQKT